MTFEEIYQTYWNKVFRLCMGFVNDHDWAKDIAQETFIAVWEKFSSFRNESAIGTWIFRIASNQCLRQLEKQKRMPKTDLPLQIEEQNQPSNEPKLNFLYQCISQLNETDRLVISLELEYVKQADIAEILGMSEINVRVKLHRIKERLTQKFKKYEQ